MSAATQDPDPPDTRPRRADIIKIEAFWDDLLADLEARSIVPVIGDELVQIHDSDGRLRPLSEVLAQRFVETFDIPVDLTAAGSQQSLSLAQAVSLYPDISGKKDSVYGSICAIYRALKPEIPEALMELARIEEISLFISTTQDDLMEQALNKVRFGDGKQTKAFSYSPNQIISPKEFSNLKSDSQKLNKAFSLRFPVVYQLFGSYADRHCVAISEADIVEFMYALLSDEDEQLKRLFDELFSSKKLRHLLLLGNRFPDWLARFFLRVARNGPYSNNPGHCLYISDTVIREDRVLLRFINRFVPNTKMIEDLHPAELVAELAKRWQKRHSERSTEDQEAPSADPPKASETPIFLSYANEDFEAADRVRAALEGVPLPVWMDKGKQREHRLNPGDIYDKKIRDIIRKCSFFMPLLSRNTNELGESYFRREWAWALERLPSRTGNEAVFIIPVIVDGLPAGELNKVPDAFKKTHIWRLPNGEKSEDFCSTVKTHYRDFKSAKR